MSLLQRFRDATFCVILLLIPFLFLNSNLKDPTEVNALDRIVLQISAPIQYAAVQTAKHISNVLEEYTWLVEVHQDKERLKRENERLRLENRQLYAQARENKRLKALLRMRKSQSGDYLSAQVIGKEVTPFFRVIRIRLDRGERDLVRAGMPVLAANGLVGQVRRVFDEYSDVLLTVDRRSAVDVVLERNGARGMLRGTGEKDRYRCRVQYLSRDDEIKVGDKIMTSGLGKRFPAAIPVGRVVKVVKQKFGLHQEADVEPIVNFSSVEHVLVALSGARQSEMTDSPLGLGTEE